ncbi:MAG TPA: UDP-2,3-diacylglucosamine diphosphatase LpxI [Devosia sp.]|nr:UDP-2,3-diacylglucosamine diphosphatase LpxI [Devosia sp.]
MTRHIALIAGSGSLVLTVITAIRNHGDSLSVLGVVPRDDLGADAIHISGAQIEPLLAAIRKIGPSHVAMAGAIHISDSERRALAVAAGQQDATPVGDMALGAIADKLRQLTGAELIDLDRLVPELMAPVGRIAGPAPTIEQEKVAAFAFERARAAGSLDLFQALVASGRRLVAAEDIGGTDLLLDRILAFRERGLVGTGVAMALAKVSKPGQPAFFDLPAIGPVTVTKAARAGIGAIVVEAGRTLLLEKPALEAEASQLGVSVFGRKADG